MNSRQLKILGSVILFILVLNLLSFAFRFISTIVFWIVIIAGAVFAYWILPRLKSGM